MFVPKMSYSQVIHSRNFEKLSPNSAIFLAFALELPYEFRFSAPILTAY